MSTLREQLEKVGLVKCGSVVKYKAISGVCMMCRHLQHIIVPVESVRPNCIECGGEIVPELAHAGIGVPDSDGPVVIR